MGAIVQKGIKYGSGNDGFSPIITVTNIENGHKVDVRDINGVKSFEVLNGADGIDAPCDGLMFTSLEELRLTAPTTVGDIFNAMPGSSMAVIACEGREGNTEGAAVHVLDVPVSFGVLTIKKNQHSRFSIEYQNSLAGAACDVKRWIGTLKGNDGTGLYWKQVNTDNHKYTTMAELALDGSTATIQDVMDKVTVGDSVMIRTDAFNNNNWQTQCNGIQWGYLKIEKTQNGLSNIELQEVVVPNRRYFGTQSSGKFAGWVATTNTTGLISNAQTFKINLTKNNASWYGMFTFNFVYGTTPCEITVAITDKVYYTITKGLNLVSALTYTQSGANYTIGIDLTAKVYGTQVVDMPREFGTINSLTAEQFVGDTTAISKGQDCNEIIYTSLSGNLAGITTVLDLVNALVTEYRALSSKKPIRFVSGEISKATLTDLPVTYGVLQITVAGWDVVEVRLAHSANGFKSMYYGYLNRISGEESISSITWKKVATSGTDIAPTTVTTFVLPDTVVNQTNNSRITYQVKNGICCIAVQLALDAVSSAVTTWTNVATGFPKPSFNISQTINSERNSSEVPMAMRMTAGGTLQMLFNGTTDTADWWTTTFTYPVAE